MTETQRWVNLALLLATGVVFLFLSKLFGALWDLARFPAFEEWPVAPAVLAAFAGSAAAGFGVRRSEKANRFLNEVVVELGKVTWPMRKETFASSSVVAVLVGIAAVFLTLFDVLWGTMARGLFRF